MRKARRTVVECARTTDRHLHAGSGSGAPTRRLPGDEDAIMRDPAVAKVGSAGGGLCTLNDGRVFIQLKPHGEREPIDKVIARLRINSRENPGHHALYVRAISPASGCPCNRASPAFSPWATYALGRSRE